MPTRVLATVALALLLAAGCGSGDVVAEDGGDAPAPSVAATPGPPLPDGWRWESYRDAAVAVPDDWEAHDSSGQRLGQWCLYEKAPARGAVARPGPSTAAGCNGEDPGLVSRTGRFVAFTGGGAVSGGPDREQVVVGRTRIVVQAPADLRARILATVYRLTSTDPSGCGLEHPIDDDAAWRPPAQPVADLSDVEALAACKYALRWGSDPVVAGTSLLSSVRLEGDAARRAVAAVAAAPAGGGPNHPEECSADYSRGDEAIVVFAKRAGRPDAAFVLRYASCDHNGFDDGAVVRTLTVASVAPFIAGPNAVNSWSGSGKEAILGHPEAAAGAEAKRRATDTAEAVKR